MSLWLVAYEGQRKLHGNKMTSFAVEAVALTLDMWNKGALKSRVNTGYQVSELLPII